MKFGLIFLIGLWCLSFAAFGELSVSDKDSEARLRAENAAAETRASTQLDRNFTLLLVALFGFAAVVTCIPLTLLALQLRRNACDRDAQLNAQQQQIDAQRQLIEALQQQIEEMSQELATLKEQSIIR